jgi:plasmid maintenance system antidote protein VapI
MPKRAREWGALDVKRAAHSGRVSRNEWHAVGGAAGLLLQVTPGQAKSWLLRTTIGSARRSVGLGAYPEIGLAAARDKARAAKAQIEFGLDPIEERKAARAALAAARRRNLTFTEAADLWIEAKLSDRPEKSRKAAHSALRRHALPEIGSMLVQDGSVHDVVRALKAVWTDKPDTAVKLRSYIEAMRGVWAELQNHALELAGQQERVDHRSLEVQREVALSLGDDLRAEELDREPELKLGPAANAIERREQFAAETEGREYEPLTQRGARVHAVRQAKAMFAEMRERLELAREAWAEAREQGQGHVSAGLAALRAVAGRQAKELDQDEIRQRLARIAGREQGADDVAHEAGGDAIRDRLKQVLGRDKPDTREDHRRKLEEEREKQRQLDLERQRERDRDLGWEL